MNSITKELENVDKEILEALEHENFDYFMSRIDEFIRKYTRLLKFEEATPND